MATVRGDSLLATRAPTSRPKGRTPLRLVETMPRRPTGPGRKTGTSERYYGWYGVVARLTATTISS